MKTFLQYITESKKVYSFKVKVAGEIPENFESNLKDRLARCNVAVFEKMKSTPVQKNPMDFPMLENAEVTIWDLVLEYPITAPEIARDIKELGLQEEYFRVRGSGEPSEVDQILDDEDANRTPLLYDAEYKEAAKIDHKEYFGADYNKNFLKELQKQVKERNKELGHGKKSPDVLGTQQKFKKDKSGLKSPVGSKK